MARLNKESHSLAERLEITFLSTVRLNQFTKNISQLHKICNLVFIILWNFLSILVKSALFYFKMVAMI